MSPPPESNKITLFVDGELTLDSLALVAQQMDGLVRNLTLESDPDAKVEWVIEYLKGGSATISTRGRSDSDLGRRVVQDVVQRYRDVGRRLHQGDITGLSDPVQENLRALTSLINGRIPKIALEVDGERWEVRQRIHAEPEKVVSALEERTIRRYYHGALRGKVVTLDEKQALYFTLQLAHTGVNVRCYPSHRQKRTLGELWDRWVSVDGLINREPETMIPKVVSSIRSITVLASGEKGEWREAFGAAPPPEGNRNLPEDRVRRLRDA